jgi:TadE-like protein
MKNHLKFQSWFRSRTFGRRMGVQSDSGQALVELAVILPVAVALLVGIAEIGRYANACIVVGHAARAGAQYAIQNRVTASDNAGITNAAQADAPGFTDLTVTPSHFCTCADGSSSTCEPTDCSGSRIIEYVKVNTQINMQCMFNYPGFPSSFDVKGQKIMRVSQ